MGDTSRAREEFAIMFVFYVSLGGVMERMVKLGKELWDILSDTILQITLAIKRRV